MADFNPANGLIRHAWEDVAGIANESGWHDHEFVSESLSPEYGVIQPQSITRNAQVPMGSPSKIRGGGEINVEWDAEQYARYIANVQRGGATPVNPVGSVYVHKLAPSESDIEFPDTMSIEIWRDDNLPALAKGCRVNSLSFELSPESFLTGAIGIAPERIEYYDGPARIDAIGAPTPTAPIIRGLPSYDGWNLVDGNVYAIVSDVTDIGTGVVGIKTKIGSASTYDGTQLNITVGNDSQGRPRYYEIFDENDARIGTRDLPVQIHLADTTNIALNHEWRFDRERTVWIPSYPSLPKFNEIYAAIFIGDSLATAEEYEIDQFSLAITRPAEPKFAIGGRHAKRVKQRGQRTVSGSLQREYLSVALRKRLERAKAFWLRVEAYSGEAIEGVYEHSMLLYAGATLLGGNTPSIGGQDSMDENYNFTCHPSGDATYPDDCTIVLTNTIASLET